MKKTILVLVAAIVLVALAYTLFSGSGFNLSGWNFSLPEMPSIQIPSIQIPLFLIGFFSTIIVVFKLATPLFIHSLVNEPNKNRVVGKSGFHLFTFPEEGKVKLVVRGDRLVRMIMLYAGHKFARVGNKQDPSYWKIIEIKPRGKAESPIKDIIWFLKPWAWYVYVTTGAVFTGIYKWQTVREYPIERIRMKRNEENAGEGSNIKLEVIEDISDHFRVREFLYPVRIAAADTKDKISVSVLLVVKGHVMNPFDAAFGTPRWEIQLVNLITNMVTNFTRIRNLDGVLSAESSTDANSLQGEILKIEEDEKKYGLQITGVDIIDISPNLTPAEKTRLYSGALAEPEAAATRIAGKAKADAIGYMNKTIADGGVPALEVLKSENLVKAAQAAGSGSIVINAPTSTSVDPMQAAILATLHNLKKP